MGMTPSGSIVHRVTRKMPLSSWTSLVEPVFSAFIASLLRRSCAVRLTIATNVALAQPLTRTHLPGPCAHVGWPPARPVRSRRLGPSAPPLPPALDDPSVTHCPPARHRLLRRGRCAPHL